MKIKSLNSARHVPKTKGFIDFITADGKNIISNRLNVCFKIKNNTIWAKNIRLLMKTDHGPIYRCFVIGSTNSKIPVIPNGAEGILTSKEALPNLKTHHFGLFLDGFLNPHSKMGKIDFKQLSKLSENEPFSEEHSQIGDVETNSENTKIGGEDKNTDKTRNFAEDKNRTFAAIPKTTNPDKLINKNILSSKNLDENSATEKSSEVQLETGIKAIDLFAPITNSSDVATVFCDNGLANSVLKWIAFNVSKTCNKFVSIYSGDYGKAQKDYKDFVKMGVFNDFAQNKSAGEISKSQKNLEFGFRSVMFSNSAMDLPGIKVATANQSLKTAFKAATNLKSGALFLYLFRNSVIDAYNLMNMSKYGKFDPLSKLNEYNWVKTDLETKDIYQKLRYDSKYPEFYENFTKTENLLTISSLELPSDVLDGLLISPSAILSKQDAVITFKKCRTALNTEITVPIDPIRTTSKFLFEQNILKVKTFPKTKMANVNKSNKETQKDKFDGEKTIHRSRIFLSEEKVSAKE
ncbi:ATP synthase, variant 2 [Bonamia ostreae]|uniref:ATP synthase, variant 2 n=1 Tax=Bonamia ostreae TaxID=126728 RepID=A0ABV2AI75_9EUKA